MTLKSDTWLKRQKRVTVVLDQAHGRVEMELGKAVSGTVSGNELEEDWRMWETWEVGGGHSCTRYQGTGLDCGIRKCMIHRADCLVPSLVPPALRGTLWKPGQAPPLCALHYFSSKVRMAAPGGHPLQTLLLAQEWGGHYIPLIWLSGNR